MAKRFTDTTKWTGNKWFRKLPNKVKLLWLYMLDTCDAVGVWEQDLELAEIMLGEEYNEAEVIVWLEGRITIINDGDKWWILDFCMFQYGALSEKSASRPVLSHIALLKKHRLWEDYGKSIHTLKDKDKDKDKEKDKEKDKDKEKKKKSIYNIFNFWLSRENLTQHKKITPNMEKKINLAVGFYGEEDVCCAIDNYSTVLGNDNQFFSYIWTLDIFLSNSKALPVFLDESKPLENWMKNNITVTEEEKPIFREPTNFVGYGK